MIIKNGNDGILNYNLDLNPLTGYLNFRTMIRNKINAECTIYPNKLIITNYCDNHFYVTTIDPEAEVVYTNEKMTPHYNSQNICDDIEVGSITIIDNLSDINKDLIKQVAIDLLEPTYIFEYGMNEIKNVTKYIKSDYIRDIIETGKNKQISRIVKYMAEDDNYSVKKCIKKRKNVESI